MSGILSGIIGGLEFTKLRRIPLRGTLGLLYKMAVFLTSLRVMIEGSSMYPTLLSGEHVLFDRLAYIRRSPKSGDVVLVRGLLDGEKAEIKRIAGIPGETIKLSDGVLTVNGIPIQESFSSEGADVWMLKQDEFFLLGDSMDWSRDSRSFGPVSQKAIKARAWLIYWPLSQWRNLYEE
jgi:signal peptidase I